MTGIKNFLNHIDFKLHKEDLWTVLSIISTFLCIWFFNITEIYENSFVENFQLIPLAIAFFLSIRGSKKTHKTFFVVISLVILLMFLRELSYGRVIFCQVDGNPYEFYKWSHYKYGFLVDYIIGIYLACGAIYAIVNKIWIDIIEIVKKVAFPFWTFLAGMIFLFLQMISEKNLHSTVVEELAELGMYFTILAFVIIYRKNLEK